MLPPEQDIMIEDAKSILRTWGAQDPNFLLCNSKLTFQMTMIPEKTQYLTQGPDGVRRLKVCIDVLALHWRAQVATNVPVCKGQSLTTAFDARRTVPASTPTGA